MAITDSLTGLHNHRHFQQMFIQELGRAKRYRKLLSLIILDVDDFKKFNDAYGHATGDKILVKVGEIVGNSLRKVDYAFRYGGEEFVVMLPETPLDRAIQVADRLRESIAAETENSVPEAPGRRVTVSVGVASFPDDGTNRETIFQVMDDNLYLAKAAGKNRVWHASRAGA
jgi:diguanylate cyclase (GGDEF)-like protein